MKSSSRAQMNLNKNNENIFNCKDIKLQLLTLYQIVFWGIVLVLKILPFKIEADLEKNIIVILSCISLILIFVVIFDVLIKSKYKWSGSLILLLTSTFMLLCKYIM